MDLLSYANTTRPRSAYTFEQSDLGIHCSIIYSIVSSGSITGHGWTMFSWATNKETSHINPLKTE